MVEVVEHQARDGDGFERVDRVRAGQGGERRSRREKSERDKALKTAGLVLLFAEFNEMIDAVFDRFDVPVEHRGVGF